MFMFKFYPTVWGVTILPICKVEKYWDYATNFFTGPTLMSKFISPCIGVCKYKLNGLCSGCGMRKSQKKAFKRMKTSNERKEFLIALILSQKRLSLHVDWALSYKKKYKKRGEEYPPELETKI